MSLTPEAVPARVCAGIDWASVDHAICILDAQGAVVERASSSSTTRPV